MTTPRSALIGIYEVGSRSCVARPVRTARETLHDIVAHE
jgi:hypothetical protein